jgi:hypothetical protein
MYAPVAMPRTTRAIGPFLAGLALWGGAQISAQDPARAQSTQPSITAANTINTYCASCHNGRLRSASGTLLDQLDVTQIAANPVLWSRAYRQLQAGAMPPGGAPRPDRATADATLIAIEHALGAQTKRPTLTDNREIATRLASMLWNSAPDAALLKDAQQKRLSDRATVERHVQRMLADDRAQTFVARFFVPWLQLDSLGKADPDKKYFPDYDVSLIPRSARRTMSRMSEMAVLATLQALHQADLAPGERLNSPRHMVCMGSTTGSPFDLEADFKKLVAW